MRSVIVLILSLIFSSVLATHSYAEVPKSVVDKFTEIGATYEAAFGAQLSRCSKGSEIVYAVTGSGGYTADTFVFSLEGRLLSHEYKSDDGTGTAGTVDIRDYECTTLDKRNGKLSKKYDEKALHAAYVKFANGLDVLSIARDYAGPVKSLLSASPEEQTRALRVLGETAKPEVIPWLAPLLELEDNTVRINAALALERIVSSVSLRRRDPKISEKVVLKPLSPSDPDLRPVAWLVLKLLRNPDDGSTQAYAASMIRYLELTEFEQELQSLLASKHPAVSNAARHALEGLGLNVEGA